MTPEKIDNLDFQNAETAIESSRTYKLDLSTKRITTMTDGLEAVGQAINKILNTFRYAYVIYSGQYGNELHEFIGEDIDYIKSNMKRILEECLTVDNRILGIDDLIIKEISKDECIVNFIVLTIYGNLQVEKGVYI